MGKTIVAIFAHPDDESFGPGGTLAKLAKENTVYVICITNGDGKMGNRKQEIALGKIRRNELLTSSKILGIKKVYFLGYRDGSLNNNIYHTLAEKIQTVLEKLQPKQLVTYESRGVSGHTDHIVASNVTSYLFYKVASIDSLWYFCIHERIRNLRGQDYFIYMPPGYTDAEINKKIDVTDVWETKVKAMRSHTSQKHDADRILAQAENLPKIEHFIVVTK